MDKKLPAHGQIACNRCYSGCDNVEFGITKRNEGGWRITANPLAWGNEEPEIIVLGFSKGPTQSGALSIVAHDSIAYKGSRRNVGKIFNHIGLLPHHNNLDQANIVDQIIANRTGRFHFGSLIRCTVEREEKGMWKGSGGGMLDKFVSNPFGKEVATNCTSEFLGKLPKRTKLIVMFGLGTKLNYVRASFDLFKQARGGQWSWINDVAYTDGIVTVVHVEHFASQGALIPRWLGEKDHPRRALGHLAIQAVEQTAD